MKKVGIAFSLFILLLFLNGCWFASVEEEKSLYELEMVVKPTLLKNSSHHMVFFRDDDVGRYTPNFAEFANFMLERDVPVAFGVMPLEIDGQNIDYVLELQEDYPDLIEIDMHSYRHKQIGGEAEGEFNNRRNHNDIYSELGSGKQIMDQYFGSQNWTGIFTVPFSEFDNDFVVVLGSTGFTGISGHYFSNRIPPFRIHHPSVYDYSTCLDIVESWSQEGIPFISEERFIDSYEKCKQRGKSVGIMLHHHVIDTEEKYEFLEWVISYVKNDTDVRIVEMESIYDRSNSSK